MSVQIDPLEGLIAKLSSDNEKLDACDTYTFTSYYDPRHKTLREALHNPSLQVRESAVKILGRVHTPESIRILDEYARHEKDFNCRLAAVEALSEIATAVQNISRELVPALVPWISTEHTNGYTDMAGIAISCLQEFGEYTKKELISLLTSKSQTITRDELIPRVGSWNDQLKLAAINVFMGMKNPGLSSWFNRAFEANENDAIRRGLIGLAGHFEEKALVSTLIKLLKNPDYRPLHPDLAEALGEIGDSKAINPLIVALKREYWENEVKMAALIALETFADTAKVRDAIADELSFDTSDITEKAADILYDYQDHRSVEYILQAGTVDEEWAIDSIISTLNNHVSHDNNNYECYIWIRENAIKSLCGMRNEKIITPLMEEMESEGPDYAIIRAILDCGSIGENALNTFVADLDWREDTISMLLSKKSPSVIPCLEWAMTIDDKSIQSSVKKALANFKTKKKN